MTLEIALLEDDRPQAMLMKHWIESGRHACHVYGTGAEFIDGVLKKSYDLLIIDWILPDTDGIEVLTRVREKLGWQLPILFVTAKDNESDIVLALKSGADDYMIKPVKQVEFLARIEALGRRATSQRRAQPKTMGCYEIDMEKHQILRSGEKIFLTQKEFELAVHLFQNVNCVLSRDALLKSIWGIDADVDTRTVDTHISRLRKKLQLTEKNGWKLVPVYGFGYRLEAVADADAAMGSVANV